MTTEELNAACDRLGWIAPDLARECCMGEWVATDMLNGSEPVWSDVEEHLAKLLAPQQH